MSRAELDSYPTPDPVAKAVVRAVQRLVPNPSVIVEPSAGSGAFVRAAREVWQQHQIVAVELDARHKPKLEHAGANFLFFEPWESWLPGNASGIPGDTLVIGNPPFSHAADHIGLALDWLMPGSHIAMLLKMNFLCSKDRAARFWPRGQLRWLQPFESRPSFIKKKRVDPVTQKTKTSSNDSNEYALFCWEVGYTGRAEIVLPHVSWEPNQRVSTQ